MTYETWTEGLHTPAPLRWLFAQSRVYNPRGLVWGSLRGYLPLPHLCVSFQIPEYPPGIQLVGGVAVILVLGLLDWPRGLVALHASEEFATEASPRYPHPAGTSFWLALLLPLCLDLQCPVEGDGTRCGTDGCQHGDQFVDQGLAPPPQPQEVAGSVLGFPVR